MTETDLVPQGRTLAFELARILRGVTLQLEEGIYTANLGAAIGAWEAAYRKERQAYEAWQAPGASQSRSKLESYKRACRALDLAEKKIAGG